MVGNIEEEVVHYMVSYSDMENGRLVNNRTFFFFYSVATIINALNA